MNDRVTKAIYNYFKEIGIEIDSIEGNKVWFLDDRYYIVEIDEEQDLMTFTNRTGSIIDTKYISSYQNKFSFTIDK